MLAAAVAAEKGARVLLIERNSVPGAKLRITGKGRCNLTNDCAVSDVLENLVNGARFMHSSVNGFSPLDAMRLFERLGVPLKTERGARVFPQSDKASDVAEALQRYMLKSGVALKCARAAGITAEAVQQSAGAATADTQQSAGAVISDAQQSARAAGITAAGERRATGVRLPEGEVPCSAVILATGGMSYPSTGSTGDGYDMARELGHTVAPLSASLVPLTAEGETCARLQGLTLKNVRVSVYDGGTRPVFEDFGELLFTHFGLSGPLALSASAHMRDIGSKNYYTLVDLKPALDEKKLDQRILRDFEKYSNKDFSNALGDLLPKSMIPVLIDMSGIDPAAKVHSITREQRRAFVALIKSMRFNISGFRPVEEAIVTSGGVELKEINPKTMESKLVHGLYFAGEIINADGYTGGFNLQIAWSTAYAAAQSAVSAIKAQ